MKHLGIDLGTKTIGLAVSDRLGIIASPYQLIKYQETQQAIDEVLRVIAKEKIEVIVLGLPKNMNNSLGPAAERSRDFKARLSLVCSLPIRLVDERLSTVEAEKLLINDGVSRAKRKKVIDGMSASIILDTYLRKEERENG